MTLQAKHTITKHSVLLVEDDQRLSSLIASYLEKQGFVVGVEHRGDTAVNRIIQEQPHIVILDLMLPGLSGMDVCKQVRQNYEGVILMLTAIDEDIEQIVGLEIGADDYVTKPIEPRVLLARIKALLRRSGEKPSPTTPIDTDVININIDDKTISINAGSRELHVANDSIKLTTSEFDLLWLLANGAGTIFSRDDLYLKLNGFPYDGIDRSMDIRISKLRKCLNDNPDEPVLIKTVRGRGYLFTTSHHLVT